MKNLTKEHKIIIGIVAAIFLIIAIVLIVKVVKKKKAAKELENIETSKDGAANTTINSNAPTSETNTNGNTKTYVELPLGSFPIKPGDKSRLVYIMQRYLNVMHAAGLKEDGKYGSNTKDAIKSFVGAENISIQKAAELFERVKNAGKQADFITFKNDLAVAFGVFK